MPHSQASEEKVLQKNLARIKKLRLIDDDFFRVCFHDDKEGAQFILRIILGKDDLNVETARTQHSIKNLHGRSAILDVFATDSQGKRYDIEVQRSNDGATPKRARYNSSLMDGNSLYASDAYTSLPETYVIFITEHDVLGDGKLIYHIDRYIAESERYFNDGSHIVYVNASYHDDSALGKLAHDFLCADPGKMNYAELRQKTVYFKEDDKGVKKMCEIWEEVWKEGLTEGRIRAAQEIADARAETAEAKAKAEAAEAKAETAEAKAEMAEAKNRATKNAIKMIKRGNLTKDEILEYTNLSEEEVNELIELLAS